MSSAMDGGEGGGGGEAAESGAGSGGAGAPPLSLSQKTRRKKTERKRKWLLAQQTEQAEHDMAVLAGRSASDSNVYRNTTVATGVGGSSSSSGSGGSSSSSSSSSGGDSSTAALQAEREARLWAEAQLQQTAAQRFTIMRTLALACAPPSAIVRPSADGKHLVELPSGLVVLAPHVLDADTASQIVRAECASFQNTGEVRASRVNAPHASMHPSHEHSSAHLTTSLLPARLHWHNRPTSSSRTRGRASVVSRPSTTPRRRYASWTARAAGRCHSCRPA